MRFNTYFLSHLIQCCFCSAYNNDVHSTLGQLKDKNVEMMIEETNIRQ